ncbi:hypothetical protein Vadar_029462 [Vaccinium darrowii]|uniref:Uncharacterized protein n=1 Tax=Vaccinium darrowii TaxID=229202 RepID=A0ACB7XKU9_9ERIC|nr:hypothetical protein Vadar_029462 [Vaccinium darrowii]
MELYADTTPRIIENFQSNLGGGGREAGCEHGPSSGDDGIDCDGGVGLVGFFNFFSALENLHNYFLEENSSRRLMDRQAHDYAAAMAFAQQQQQQATNIQQQQQFGFHPQHQQFPPSVHGPPFLSPHPSLQQYPFPHHLQQPHQLHPHPPPPSSPSSSSANNSHHLLFLLICPLILVLHLYWVHTILCCPPLLPRLILNSRSVSINWLSILPKMDLNLKP